MSRRLLLQFSLDDNVGPSVLFLFFYLCFVVLAVILLINLLIAMMGSTYARHTASTPPITPAWRPPRLVTALQPPCDRLVTAW